ncbi:MAG: PIN domain-containing protein [Rickettsiales bacterium]|jgi:tRNA(fMet)-specific endonuclease VapC|nr:PIN domain-containing protein [Rickettsiales bacterium]
MRYLLDTCVITDFVKNNQKTVEKIKQLSPRDLCISVITTSEIEYGIQKINETKKGDHIIKVTNALVGIIEEVSVDHNIAIEAGMIRARLVSEGIIVGAHDILIAATAKVNKLVMITNNIKDFIRIDGLAMESWKED